jgi:hypothetical protein
MSWAHTGTQFEPCIEAEDADGQAFANLTWLRTPLLEEDDITVQRDDEQ